MNQRVMIAMALAGQPDLLVADEPTTALDATIQAQILELLREIRRDSGMALVLISHDLGVVAENTDRVCVMYAGRIVEDAPIDTIFDAPAHPYTSGLLAALPELDGPRRRLVAIPGVVPEPWNLPPGCSFAPRCAESSAACEPPCRRDRLAPATAPPASMPGAGPFERAAPRGRRPRPPLRGPSRQPAVRPSRDLARRRRRVVHLAARPHAGPGGRIGLRQDDDRQAGAGPAAADRRRGPAAGRDLAPAGSTRWRELRRGMQMVYQDPLAALDRRLAVGEQVMEPLAIHGHRRAGRAARARRWRSWRRSACRRTTSTAIRTSCRAASASASCWRAR